MTLPEASAAPIETGYFGKVPTQGDFVTRGFRPALADRFDGWLRQCVRESQTRMGRDWLQAFLVAPVWRMAISPGLFGPDAIIGVMMPSVDRAGRYFPLVIAASIPDTRLGAAELAGMTTWYDAAEEMALSTLDADFSLNWFDSQITAMQIPASMLPNAGEQAETGSLWWTGHYGGRHVSLDHMPQPEFFDRLFLTPPPGEAATGSETAADEETRPQPTAHDDTPPDHHTHLHPTRVPLKAHVGCAIRRSAQQLVPPDQIVVNQDQQAITLLNGFGSARNLRGAVQQVADTLSSLDEPLSMSDLIAGAKGRLGTANSLVIARGSAIGAVYPIAFVTLLLQAQLFAILWAGNARAYLLRDGTLNLLTRDHIDRRLPAVLTRSLGTSKQLSPEQICAEAISQDRFLLCSASISAILSDTEIHSALSRGTTAEDVAQSLTQGALIGGATGCVSAAAVFIA
ncbi:type VI secretion system-associated protein TagF [Paracoccus sp. (in: a-proteobacteria)]|uniref:type VI secretion system-associated protein TagF n=1 Tax=Paracoccus sp. TaxID=267 RepID=UPI003A8BD81C